MKKQRLKTCVALTIGIVCLIAFRDIPIYVYLTGDILLEKDICSTKLISNTSIDLSQKKVILHLGENGRELNDVFKFDGCEYSNCVFQYCDGDGGYASRADVILFSYNSPYVYLNLPSYVRQRQIWLAYSMESLAYGYLKWPSPIDHFDGIVTYLQNSHLISLPFGFKTVKKVTSSTPAKVNYAQGKTKGAFTYVSNCKTFYNRMQVIKDLSKSIDIDVFGDCTGRYPCASNADFDCKTRLHSQYHFYLAFEDSLCKEFITDQFWNSLKSDGYFIPVSLGGLSLEEYTRVAPPNSFLHLYNFSTVSHMGQYLQHLLTYSSSFNRYHQWRNNYTISTKPSKHQACQFCKAINNPEKLKVAQDRKFANEWNNLNNCRPLWLSASQRLTSGWLIIGLQFLYLASLLL